MAPPFDKEGLKVGGLIARCACDDDAESDVGLDLGNDGLLGLLFEG